MTRNTVAMILGGFYVAVSAWIVSSQGRAHRDALHQANRQGHEVAKATVKPDPEVTGRLAPAPGKTPDTLDQVEKGTPPGEPVSARSGQESHPPKEGNVGPELVVARPAAQPPPITRANTPERAGPISPDSLTMNFAKATGTDVSRVKPVVVDPFWEQPFATKKWDVADLSAEEEARLGRDLHELVMHFNSRYEKAAAQQRVEEAAEPILTARNRKDIEYKFFVLDSSVVNAFSHPGGYIYVTRGLLDWISEDETSALQFVLAHEIFHVDRRHALICLQDPGVKALPYGTVQLFYMFIFPRGYYPEQMDFDADAWALLQLERLQCTRRECMTFIRKLKGYAEANNWELERAKALPRSGARESLFDNHFRAHPTTYQRLRRLEALADQTASKSK